MYKRNQIKIVQHCNLDTLVAFVHYFFSSNLLQDKFSIYVKK